MSAPQPTGSHPIDGERRKSRWWLWLLLAALLIALLIWAITALTGDDEEEATAPMTTSSAPATTADPEESVSPSTPAVPSTTDGSTTGETSAPPAPDAAAGAVAGTVVVGSVDVLTSGTDLETLAGQPAEGTDVQVTEVVADESFYVGPEAGETVLVRLPAFAGADAPESPFTVEQGDVVSFSGTLAQVDDALLADLRNYDPSTELQVGSVYVQAEQISGVS